MEILGLIMAIMTIVFIVSCTIIVSVIAYEMLTDFIDTRKANKEDN